MKSFLTSILKIAAAILLVVIIVAVGAWGIVSWQSYSEHQRNATLEKTRQWPKLKGPDSEEISFKTMWRDSRLFYQFHVQYPRFQLEKEKLVKRGRRWILVLEDSDGFEIMRHTLEGMIDMVNRNGELTGVGTSSSTFMSADDYRRVNHWYVNWVEDHPVR